MSGPLAGRREHLLAIVLAACLLAGGVVALPAATAAGSGATAGSGPASASAVSNAWAAPNASAVATESAASTAQSDGVPDVDIEQTARGNVFLTNETPSLVLDANGADLAWTVRDFDGRIVDSGTVFVDGETTIEPSVDGVGHYTLRVRSADGGDDGSAEESTPQGTITRTTLAVLPADGFDHGDEFFAMSTKFGAGRDHAMMDTLELAGVAAVRDEHGWHAIEGTRGEYDFSGPDRAAFMQSLRERGFDRLFLLVYANEAYADEWEGIFTFPATDEARQGYANYTQAVLREYPELDHVEVWNEPNIESFSVGPAGQDPTAYAELLATTHDAVEETRPGVTVVGGSTTRNHTGTNQVPPGIDYQYWEGIYEADGAEHMDAAALHLYRRQPENFAEDLDSFHELTREYNDGEAFPIWVTELGWPTSPHMPGGDGESMQAQHLVQSHARLQAAGVERYYWYTQVDTFYEDRIWQHADGSDQFGLLRGEGNPLGDYTPKPSYLAYATMTRQLAGAEFQGQTADPVQLYRFASEDGPVRVLWAEERTDLTIRTDDPVTVTTMTGSEQTLRPVDGEVYLTVGPDPSYVGGAIDGVEVGAPVDVEGVLTSEATNGDEPGERARARVVATYTNEGSADRTVEHRIGDTSFDQPVAAGESASAAIAVPRVFGDRAGVAVDLVHVDGQPVGRLEAPVGVPRAQFSEPAFVSGMTVETANEGQWTGFSEVDDVGADRSAFTATSRAGVPCYESDVDAGDRGRRLYVDVSDDHAGGLGGTVPVTVRYYDDGEGTFGIEYADGTESGSAIGAVELDGDGRWETHTFELDDAAFPTATGDIVANGNHDFEITLQGSLIGVSQGDVCFESVTLGTAPTTAIDPTDDGSGSTTDGDGEDAADGDGTADGSSDGETEGDGGTGSDGASDDSDASGSDANGSDGDESGGGDALPGFGVAVTLVALVAGSWLLRRGGDRP